MVWEQEGAWNPRWNEDTNKGKRIKDEWNQGPCSPIFQLVTIKIECHKVHLALGKAVKRI